MVLPTTLLQPRNSNFISQPVTQAAWKLVANQSSPDVLIWGLKYVAMERYVCSLYSLSSLCVFKNISASYFPYLETIPKANISRRWDLVPRIMNSYKPLSFADRIFPFSISRKHSLVNFTTFIPSLSIDIYLAHISPKGQFSGQDCGLRCSRPQSSISTWVPTLSLPSPIFIAIALWGTKDKVKKTEKQRLIGPVVWECLPAWGSVSLAQREHILSRVI